MIEFNGVCAYYGKKEVLHSLDIKFEKNKTTVILGKNGSGKSTLVSCVIGAVNYKGNILIDGKNISEMKASERAKKVAVLPQMLLTPNISVYELVCIGRTPYLDIGKRLSKYDREAVRKAINAVGLSEMENRTVSTLSGGERQKAYIAMILAQESDAVIFDEPTSFLDMESRSMVLDVINELKNDYRKTVILIMHDFTKAVEIADNILVIEGGNRTFYGSVSECIENKVIEKSFNVKSAKYTEDGLSEMVFYY